ncbi:MAG: hypothetical protein ACO1RX_18355 [Candidatus Sericytochromatia bacterium]
MTRQTENTHEHASALVTALTPEQNALVTLLADFRIPPRAAEIMARFYSHTLIREQMDVFFFEKSHPETPRALVRAIETAERRAHEFALRALEHTQAEIVFKRDDEAFLQSLEWGQTRFISQQGTVFLVRGRREMDGKPQLLVETRETQGRVVPMQLANAKAYRRLTP